MSEPRPPGAPTPPPPAVPATLPTDPSAASAPSAAGPAVRPPRGWSAVLLSLALLLGAVALAFAWRSEQRLASVEQELVRRQQDSASQVNEARILADQAQHLARDAAARSALLERRVTEVALQRSQLDELIGSLSRSRDENLVADLDAGIRVALQQTAITGSAAPLVAALSAAEERLARVGQPRLESVRRAIARDLDRIRSVGVADVASLVLKLDEGMRLVDDAPLLAFEPPRPDPKPARPARARPAARAATAASAASAASAPATPAWLAAAASDWWQRVWSELRGLVRLTRVDEPQAMLLAPEQSYFLRENLKLRLLNARVALLSRQFDLAQSDLQAAIAAAETQFDRQARKTSLLVELLRSIASQARQGGVPRPDDTLAALATAAAGR